MLANAHPPSSAGASAVLANAHPLLFAGASAVSANSHPLFVGVIEVVNAHPPSFAGMPMVVSEEKIDSVLFEGLIVAVLANVSSVSFVAVAFIVSEGDVNPSSVPMEQATERWDRKDMFAGRTEICVVLTIFCALVEPLSTTPCARFLV